MLTTRQVLPRAERTASVLGIDRRALQHVHKPDPRVPDVQGSLLGGLLGVALAEGREYRLMLVHDFLGAARFFPDHHPGHDRPVQDAAGLGLAGPETWRTTATITGASCAT